MTSENLLPPLPEGRVGSINELSDEEMFTRIVCKEELNKDVIEKKRWPRPKFAVMGRRLLVLQDEAKDRVGTILVPDAYQKKYQVSAGILMQIGDGWDPDGGNWNPPYEVGDRVVWGKYNDMEVEIDVESGWWTEEELKRPGSKRVKFIILEYAQVKGVLI
jgi:co-chaperonin GroES (HSP10)